MTNAHPLDRPVWSSLTTRQASLSLGDAKAKRFAPDYGVFAATADRTPESIAALAALIPANGAVALVEPDDAPAPDGVMVAQRAECYQMMARDLAPARSELAFLELGDADAAEMLALATLTQPGPFFARTHRMGDFIGVRQGSRLIAMAGERMKPDGFTEVSAVCTHPDHRGKGYARNLMGVVAARILARGETPFLHVYAHNKGAIALYEALGFARRRSVILTVLARGAGKF